MRPGPYREMVCLSACRRASRRAYACQGPCRRGPHRHLPCAGRCGRRVQARQPRLDLRGELACVCCGARHAGGDRAGAAYGERRALRDAKGIVDIRGRGLMMGVELDRPCGELVTLALEAGLLINVTADFVIRLLPALVMNEAEARTLVAMLAPLVREFLARPLAQAQASRA